MLKYLNNIDISNKNILVRLDLDVPITSDKSEERRAKILSDKRLVETLPTVECLLKKQARLTIIGHMGRPQQKAKNKEQKTEFQIELIRQWYQWKFPSAKLFVAKNLRFEAGEEENDPIFAKDIVRRFQAQVYVFDAFAVAHRLHASVVGIPKLLPTVLGFRFQSELDHLNPVLLHPKRPLVFVIGGAKPETKIPLIEKLMESADTILAGGILPLKINPKKEKLVVAKLKSDSLDITEESAKLFVEKIRTAGTVVWNGPMGAYENIQINQYTNKSINQWQTELRNTPAYGTYMVAKAVSETPAFTVVGGGDTEAALSMLDGTKGINWVSSGGGALLHYLAYGTLPLLEAVKD